MLPKLLAEGWRWAGWSPARPGRPFPEGTRQVGRALPWKLHDDAVQILEVMGVAATDRQQWPTVPTLEATVQRQQGGDLGVGVVVRVEELEAVNSELVGQP